MANEAMREHWTTGAEGWVRHRELFDAELAPFGEAVLSTVEFAAGDRVLDVGCGTGAITAGLIASGAEAVGLDISPVMIDAARARVPDASFVVADAQVDDVAARGPFAAIVSRFGVMFFDDPVGAFANLRRSAAPGAHLVFVCWRSAVENQMFTLGTDLLLARMDPPPPTPQPGAPGPDAFADAERVESILADAGWSSIAATPFDALVDYGGTGRDGVEERLTMILNTGAGRKARDQLEPALGPAGWASLLDEIRADLRRHLVDGRVQFGGATWLVSARNPA